MPDPAPAPRTLRVGLTQWRPTRDVAANLATAVSMIGAAGPQSDLVLLPENGLMLGSNTEMRAAALSVESPEIDELREAAKGAAATVVLGGFKRRHESGQITNTALVIGPDGAVAGGYNKIHLFDARVAGQSFEASSVERPGTHPVILDVSGVRLGVTICYDVRFPELYRRLALDGVEVFLVPAAFTRTTGSAHWEVLLRARAIESAAFVVASATVGGDDGTDAFETYGHALAVDPWGTVLADLGDAAPAWRVLELPLSEVERVRDSLPVLAGVRTDACAAGTEIIEVGSGRLGRAS